MNNTVAEDLFLDGFIQSGTRSNNQLDDACSSSGISLIDEETENSMMSTLNHATALIGNSNQSIVKYPKKYSFYFKNQFSPSKSDQLDSSSSSHLHRSCKILESPMQPSINEGGSVSSPMSNILNNTRSVESLAREDDANNLSLFVRNDFSIQDSLSSLLPSALSRNLDPEKGVVSTSGCAHENNSSLRSTVQENYASTAGSCVVENDGFTTDSTSSFWCSECKKMYKTAFCSKHPVLNIIDKVVQTTARASLPSILLLKRIKQQTQSNIDLIDAEYGIFAKNHLPRRVRFGPVKGVFSSTDEKEIVPGKFVLSIISEESNAMHLNVDDESTSNWMRFIRPAEKVEQQNLIVDQYGSDLYYTATRIIKPKEEFRVWYSMEYAVKRKIPLLMGDPYYRDVRMYIKYGIRPSTSQSLSEKESKQHAEKTRTKNGNGATKQRVELEATNERNKRIDDDIAAGRSYKFTKTRYGRIVKPRPDENDGLNRLIWSCKVCYLPFQNEALLNCHIVIHRKTGSSSNRSETTQHDEISSSEYKCPKCEQTFVDIYNLAEHVEAHSLEKECEFDGTVSSHVRKTDVEDGKQRRKMWCRICKGIFFDNHWRMHKVKKTYDCILCDKENLQKKELRQHLKTHRENGQFKCPSCSKVSDRYVVMYKHIRNCHGELKTCNYCSRQFRDRHKLLLHILRHMNRKDYLCAICGKQFSRADKLTGHIKNIHAIEREESKLEKLAQIKEKKEQIDKLKYETLRYKCHICKTGYRLLNSFINHVTCVHPSVDIQSICATTAANNDVATGDQQNASSSFTSSITHQCEYCFKNFSKRSNLLMHQRKKHKELVSSNPKPAPDRSSYTHQCDWCLKRYSKRGNLLAHQRKIHKEQMADLAKSNAVVDVGNNNNKSIDEEPRRILAGTDNNVINLAQILNGSSSAPDGQSSSATIQIVQDGVQLNDINEEIEFTATIDADVLVALKQSLKNSTAEIVDINHVDEDQQRDTPNTEQYLQCLKLLSSSGVVSPHAEHAEGTFSVINVDNGALLQQILSAYPFISQ